MSTMKTEVVVIRLTKQERAALDSIKRCHYLQIKLKELAALSKWEGAALQN